jgi:hypothetical protein
MTTVFVILAIFFLLIMIIGIILLRKKISWHNLNGTFLYRGSPPLSKKNDTHVKHWQYGIQKMKGKIGFINIKYKIPEFYQKLRSGDQNTIRFSVLVLGLTGFVLFTFLTIGTAMLEGGNSNGWYFIGAIMVFMVLVIFLHIRAINQQKKT